MARTIHCWQYFCRCLRLTKVTQSFLRRAFANEQTERSENKSKKKVTNRVDNALRIFDQRSIVMTTYMKNQRQSTKNPIAKFFFCLFLILFLSVI